MLRIRRYVSPSRVKIYFRKRHVGRVINAAGPKSQQIGTMLADKVIGSGWLLVCAGFGDFFPSKSTTKPWVTQILYGARLFSAMLVISDD